MGPGIPAPNINTWSGFGPAVPQRTPGILPDPDSGSLYNSTVPMTDTDLLAPNFAGTIAAPWIPTAFTQVGTPGEYNTWS
jgi:hypothetical protein